ncbi:MAG: hypothetical protein H6Q11_1672, partial [Acidobacteria bacterium]|nr:hypothetical protein [Acidobacteriota bacterium]
MTQPPDPAAERLPPGMRVDAFGLSHTGKVRATNADSFLIMRLSRPGPAEGATPSAGEGGRPGPSGYLYLVQGVRQVHQEVRTEAEREGRPGAATTLTLVVLFWPKAYLVHVGDSRAYRLRDDRLELLSHDQTVAQALVDAGALTASKGEISPLKHILTSAIGAEEATPEVQVDTARPDDVLLLCTDGLTKPVTEAELEATLREGQAAEPTVRRLVDLA